MEQARERQATLELILEEGQRLADTNAQLESLLAETYAEVDRLLADQARTRQAALTAEQHEKAILFEAERDEARTEVRRSLEIDGIRA
jgi:hypothetical protein